MREPIPDVLVELLLLGELDAEEADAVRSQLEAEGDPRLAKLEASNAEIFEAYPPPRVVAELRGADPVVVPLRPSWVVAAVIAASVLAAVGLLWIVLPSEDATAPERVAVHQSAADDGIRDKGTMRLLVHREGESLPLEAGAVVRAGDVLQLSYAGASQFGVIVSLDGAGVATLHFPATEVESTRLGSGLVRLDHAYELDDAPGFERFFLVSAPHPLDPSEVLERVRGLNEPRTDTPNLPASWSLVSVLLAKSRTP